jgi:hypothetical protein
LLLASASWAAVRRARDEKTKAALVNNILAVSRRQGDTTMELNE